MVMNGCIQIFQIEIKKKMFSVCYLLKKFDYYRAQFAQKDMFH